MLRLPAAERRDQLIEAALDLFAQKGFAGTTTKEIAKAAGVTEAVIFRHFETKQALYIAILDTRLKSDDFQAVMTEADALMAAGDDEGLMRLIATKIIESFRKDSRFERLMLFAALEGHEIALMHFERTSPIFLRFIDYLSQRQRDGFLRPMNPGLFILAIAGMAHHYGTMCELMPHKKKASASDAEVVEAFTSIMMNGIRAVPAELKSKSESAL